MKAHRIHRALDDDRIVLVAGFQGVSTEYDVTTLGRGGSDTTAVALAAALGADACEIYTDVDGVFTADPRVVPAPQKLHAVSYEEMLELAASGAKAADARSSSRGTTARWSTSARRSPTSPARGSGGGRADAGESVDLGRDAHAFEEAVYEVDDVRPADLFEALAEAEVNVDTVIQMDSRIVFLGAGRGPRQRRAGPREARHRVLRAARAGEGERRRRRDEEPSWSRLPHLRRASWGLSPFVATSLIKIAFYVLQDSVEATVRALHDSFELASPEAERHHDA